MTLSPNKIGDKGQRYVIYYTDRYTGKEHIFGYSNNYEGALAFQQVCKNWPRAGAGRIEDRVKK